MGETTTNKNNKNNKDVQLILDTTGRDYIKQQKTSNALETYICSTTQRAPLGPVGETHIFKMIITDT